MAKGSPEVKRLVKELEKRGWTVASNNHFFCYSPDTTHCYSIPKSASDHRSMKNTYSIMRRNGENVEDLKHLFR